MIKIPLKGWSASKDTWREVCAYLSQNVAPVSPLSVLHNCEDTNYRFHSSPIIDPDKYWTVEREVDGLSVSAQPSEHETFLALKFGVEKHD